MTNKGNTDVRDSSIVACCMSEAETNETNETNVIDSTNLQHVPLPVPVGADMFSPALASMFRAVSLGGVPYLINY